jgi:hypothetical protein
MDFSIVSGAGVVGGGSWLAQWCQAVGFAWSPPGVKLYRYHRRRSRKTPSAMPR